MRVIATIILILWIFITVMIAMHRPGRRIKIRRKVVRDIGFKANRPLTRGTQS